MLISKKQHLLNTLSLSILSLILGYALWQAMSQPYKLEAKFSVPLSFYNAKNVTLEAPETITLRLQGTRKDLYKTASNLALHYDARHLEAGTHTLKVTNENLFLPESVLLLHYLPIEITATRT